jgi:hypothetical protein
MDTSMIPIITDKPLISSKRFILNRGIHYGKTSMNTSKLIDDLLKVSIESACTTTVNSIKGKKVFHKALFLINHYM